MHVAWLRFWRRTPMQSMAVTLENVVINGFTTAGINIPSSTQSNSLTMRNVIIRNCAIGVNVANTGANTTAFNFDGVNINRNSNNGISAGAGTQGMITRSTIAA